jgi:hypothetical protein
MSEFTWHRSEFGDIEEYDACSSLVPIAEFDVHDPRRRGEKKNLCEICANSYVGRVVEYIDQDSTVLRTIAQVGNQVLLKLGAFPEKGNA